MSRPKAAPHVARWPARITRRIWISGVGRRRLRGPANARNPISWSSSKPAKKVNIMTARRDLLKLAALPYLPLRATASSATGFPTQIAARVTRAFSTPGAAPNGLQAAPEGLWILDQATNRVALVDYQDGRVIRQFDTETDKGSGITFDGSALWIASTYNRLLVRVDAQNGRTLKKLPSPGS